MSSEEQELTPEIARRMFGDRQLGDEPEQVEPVAARTDDEDAQAKRILTLQQEQREQQRQREQVEPEVSPERQHAAEVSEMLRPASKRAAAQALIESMHPSED